MGAKKMEDYRFIPGGPYVARRTVRVMGQTYEAGDDLPADVLPVRRWRQLFESRRVVCLPADDTAGRAALHRIRRRRDPEDTSPAPQPAPAPAPAPGPAVPTPAPEEAPEADPVDTADPDAEPDAEPNPEVIRERGPGGYKAKHVGGGKYVVVDARGNRMTDTVTRTRAHQIAVDLNGAEEGDDDGDLS